MTEPRAILLVDRDCRAPRPQAMVGLGGRLWCGHPPGDSIHGLVRDCDDGGSLGCPNPGAHHRYRAPSDVDELRARLFLAVVRLSSAAAWPRHDPGLGCGRLVVVAMVVVALVLGAVIAHLTAR